MKKAFRNSNFVELRRKAEELLENCVGEHQGTGILNLINELEAYLTELQTQNKELLHSRLELEESKKAYADLYDLAPIGYITTNKEGNITAANLLASAMLRISSNELYGLRFSSLILPDDHKVYFKLIGDVAERKTRKSSGEIRLLQHKKIPFMDGWRWHRPGICVLNFMAGE